MLELMKAVGNLALRSSDAADAEEAIKLATSAKILGDVLYMLKEVELHERYHMQQEDQLVGEAPLRNLKN